LIDVFTAAIWSKLHAYDDGLLATTLQSLFFRRLSNKNKNKNNEETTISLMDY
jgi:hypothetical protein